MGQSDRRNALLQVDRLNVSYSVGTRSVTAVRDISLAVRAGEIVAILGESGSGKSSLARAIVGLSPKEATVSGDIRYGNHLISDFNTDYQEKLFGRLRGRIVASVFQDAAAALHPLLTIGKQMADVMMHHFPNLTNSEVRVKSRHILKLLHLPPEAKDAYPHELSGGQKQRAMLAIALAARPRLLVADEMTSALDQKTKSVLLDLVNGLSLIERMGILYITPAPQEAESLCASRVIVMYAGECMESGSREHVLDGALHPYTKRLLDSDPAKAERQTVITAGERVTSPMEGACPYYNACPRRTSYCRMEKPFLQKVKEDHYVRCHYVPMEDD